MKSIFAETRDKLTDLVLNNQDNSRKGIQAVVGECLEEMLEKQKKALYGATLD